MTPATLVIEYDEGGDIWLCSDDQKTVQRLAKFESLAASRRFVELFDFARAVSHAQGQSGI